MQDAVQHSSSQTNGSDVAVQLFQLVLAHPAELNELLETCCLLFLAASVFVLTLRALWRVIKKPKDR